MCTNTHTHTQINICYTCAHTYREHTLSLNVAFLDTHTHIIYIHIMNIPCLVTYLYIVGEQVYIFIYIHIHTYTYHERTLSRNVALYCWGISVPAACRETRHADGARSSIQLPCHMYVCMYVYVCMYAYWKLKVKCPVTVSYVCMYVCMHVCAYV
jgi:hypothetical protein